LGCRCETVKCTSETSPSSLRPAGVGEGNTKIFLDSVVVAGIV
jgi:hypothetical protein